MWTNGLVVLSEAFASTAVSEIGDRSFFTATLLALRYPRWIVFFATFAALLIQSLCSAAAGGLIQKFAFLRGHLDLTKYLVAFVFLGFAAHHALEAKRCYRAPGSRATDTCCNDQYPIEDVENIPLAEHNQLDVSLLNSTATGSQSHRGSATWPEEDISSDNDDEADECKTRVQTRRDVNRSRAFWRIFTLIYLAEVGDTSMLVTAALATTSNFLLVFLGAAAANAVVNGLGIWAGSATSAYLSDCVVNVCAAVLFCGMGSLSLLEVLGKKF